MAAKERTQALQRLAQTRPRDLQARLAQAAGIEGRVLEDRLIAPGGHYAGLLGDAELAEQGVMALSGHRTPQAARLYVKRTEQQRQRAAAKRRAWVERNETSARVEMDGGSESGNGTDENAQVPGERPET